MAQRSLLEDIQKVRAKGLVKDPNSLEERFKKTSLKENSYGAYGGRFAAEDGKVYTTVVFKNKDDANEWLSYNQDYKELGTDKEGALHLVHMRATPNPKNNVVEVPTYESVQVYQISENVDPRLDEKKKEPGFYVRTHYGHGDIDDDILGTSHDDVLHSGPHKTYADALSAAVSPYGSGGSVPGDPEARKSWGKKLPDKEAAKHQATVDDYQAVPYRTRGKNYEKKKAMEPGYRQAQDALHAQTRHDSSSIHKIVYHHGNNVWQDTDNAGMSQDHSYDNPRPVKAHDASEPDTKRLVGEPKKRRVFWRSLGRGIRDEIKGGALTHIGLQTAGGAAIGGLYGATVGGPIGAGAGAAMTGGWATAYHLNRARKTAKRLREDAEPFIIELGLFMESSPEFLSLEHNIKAKQHNPHIPIYPIHLKSLLEGQRPRKDWVRFSQQVVEAYEQRFETEIPPDILYEFADASKSTWGDRWAKVKDHVKRNAITYGLMGATVAAGLGKAYSSGDYSDLWGLIQSVPEAAVWGKMLDTGKEYVKGKRKIQVQNPSNGEEAPAAPETPSHHDSDNSAGKNRPVKRETMKRRAGQQPGMVARPQGRLIKSVPSPAELQPKKRGRKKAVSESFEPIEDLNRWLANIRMK